MSKSKILFQLSGSISCFKAAQVISTLVQRGHEVKCVATKSALQFIGAATLEGLTGTPVFSDSFESGQMMNHIDLARWADIFVLCPATANTINKLSQGIADDVIGQLFLAKGSIKPYLIFPAMNREMYTHPATQEGINKLAKWGAQVMPTGVGHQACGEIGEGRLLEPSEVVASIEGTGPSLNILITAGATREKIDDIRFISNISTGQTAANLADYFLGHGHKITYLAGQGTNTPLQIANIFRFSDFKSLSDLLKEKLASEKFDIVIHAAAVSDYSVSKITAQGKVLTRDSKISSRLSELTLELTKTKKIISEIKAWDPKACVVAFKLTSGADGTEIKRAVQKLASESRPDLIVHNDFSQMKNKDERVFRLFSGMSDESLGEANNTTDLAKLLIERSATHDLSS